MVKQKVVRTYPDKYDNSTENLDRALEDGYKVKHITKLDNGVVEYILETELVEIERIGGVDKDMVEFIFRDTLKHTDDRSLLAGINKSTIEEILKSREEYIERQCLRNAKAGLML